MPNWSSNSQTQMPSSSASTGTPRSGRSQQLLPSAIMLSILTLMGSERALPRATSRSNPASGPSLRTPYSSSTPSSLVFTASSRPASPSIFSYSSFSRAPETQPDHASMLLTNSFGSLLLSPRNTMSETAKRPPGFSTRNASEITLD